MHRSFSSIGQFGDELAAGSSIAIVGMSCRFADVRSLDEFWTLLREGREAIAQYSAEDLLAAGVDPAHLRNPNYVRSGIPLADMECFDAGLFGLSPRDASIMDPQHRHFLECSWEALENAGHTPGNFGGVIGVFAGSGHNAYMPYNLLTNRQIVEDIGLFLLRHTSNDKDFLSTRVSYLLDLKGPSVNIQTACSTSLVAIHMAAQSLLGGECDMALAGGASIELPHRHGYLFEEGEILSPDGHCRPFDADSQGTVFGSGVAVVALRRLEDAIASGDHIHAVILGSAINNDGASKVGYLAPSVDGQAKAISEALAMAGVDPATVGYVEAHGTGTPIGDPIEVAALTQAFRSSASPTQQCAIGSVKANIGHTDTAAGAAGVIKVALSMARGELPPVPNFRASNPNCAFESSPFRVQAEHGTWHRAENSPRRAGVSSLGVGGTNSHVVMEEAPPRPDGSPSRRRQLLVCSGKSASTADANAARLAGHFAGHEAISLADAAYTLSVGRQHFAHRRYGVASNAGEASASLQGASGKPVARQPCIPGRPVAFMFCGAGPHHAGMAHDLYEAEPGFRANVDWAFSLLERIGVPDMRRWLFPAEDERELASRMLARPSVGLPALFIVQTALAKLWMSIGIEPAAMIGHSSGEYAAAHLAGIIDMEAGLRIVHTRGRLFEQTADGGMISVALSEEELKPLLPAGLSIAAINAPRLCVVAGASATVDRFHRSLEETEIEAQRVPISVAAHSPLLDPVLDEFRSFLQGIRFEKPQIPFASNLTGKWVQDDEVIDPEYWVRHLREPVRFTDGLECLLQDRDTVLLEVGPGRSMTSLARQHSARLASQPVVNSMRHPTEPIEDDARFLEALGELWSVGVEPDWGAWWECERRLRIQLPTYQFDRQRHWVEPGASLSLGSAAAGTGVRREMGDWFYEPVWAREDLNANEPGDGPVLVLEDDAGLGDAVVRRLSQHGDDVVSVKPGRRFARKGDRFTLRPGDREDWARLFDLLAREDRLPRRVYHCWLVTGALSHPDHRKVLDLGLYSLLAMTPELASACDGSNVRIVLVTDGAQRVGSDRAVLPAKATAIGAARVVGSEYRGLSVVNLDVELAHPGRTRSGASLIGSVIDELARQGDGRDVALRAGERWVLGYRPKAGTDALDQGVTAPVTFGRTYLITGGLGGLGLAIARHLAGRQDARIVLLGRKALPPREEWSDLLGKGSLSLELEDRIRQVLALEATGAEIEILTADVADVGSLRRAVARAVARFGPISGVFHTAGVLDDGLIEGRTPESVAAVLRPKVDGTLALEKVLRSNPPEFTMLFSSISAFAGIPGQIDYAAANAFLDSYAEARRQDPRTRVISVGWSQWAEIGMAAALGRRTGRASHLPGDLGPGKPLDHPFLDTVHQLSDKEFVFAGNLSPSRHWLLDEHRIVGSGSVLPGTGYLELVRAAMAVVDPGPMEFSDFVFLKPFAVPDGDERALRVHLRRRADGGWRVEVLGRSGGVRSDDWTLHANGVLRRQGMPSIHATFDIDAIAARCRSGQGGSESQPMLKFGPRWNNIRRTLLGEDEALLQLELPPGFSADLETVHLHPALLDFATAGAQALIPDRNPDHFFAPFTYRRFILQSPLPGQVFSYIRYRGNSATKGATAVFDVTITDPDGRVLAEITDFTMMRIQDAGHLAGRAADSAENAKEDAGSAPGEKFEGILPDEGMLIVERLMEESSQSRVVVSPYDLDSLLADLSAPPKVRRLAASSDPGDGPTTEMEQLIADIWCDLLGIEAIGRNDNFFDLGGHSLLAVQFTNRLRKKTGRILPLAAMLGQPTLASLGQILEPGSHGADCEPEAGEVKQQNGGVITIRDGKQSTPLFFVHDGLGETLLYRGLAQRLDPDLPVLGFEPLRTPDGNYAHTRIEEMAANYIRRMQAIQREGPYLLAGLCAGGVIAFEMARQLQEMGQRVAFVGIIDAADVQATKLPFLDWRIRIARARALLAASRPAEFLPELCRKALNIVRWEVGSRIKRARDRWTVHQLRTAQPEDVAESAGKPSIPFLKLYELAHLEHRPSGVFEGGIVALFKASDLTGITDDMPYRKIYSDFALGWGKRVRDDIVIFDVPGGHSSNLQSPHVETLARLFQGALDTALADIRSRQRNEKELLPREVAVVAA